MTILKRPTATNRILHLSITAVTRMERVESHTAFFGSACFINPRDDIIFGFLLPGCLNDDSLAALVLEFNLVYRFENTGKEGKKFGATRRSRTGDLLITNQLLYRLS
jgi:hypothetical protein